MTDLKKNKFVLVFNAIKSPKKTTTYGENGFITSSKEEWSKYIDILRDPEIRNRIGEKARDSVLKQYSVQSKADEYLDIIKRYYDNKLSKKTLFKWH